MTCDRTIQRIRGGRITRRTCGNTAAWSIKGKDRCDPCFQERRSMERAGIFGQDGGTGEGRPPPGGTVTMAGGKGDTMADHTKIHSEGEMREWLQEAIEAYTQEQESEGRDAPETTSSFKDAGVLTRNEGIVIPFADGREFQITIVRSKEAE